MIALALTGVCLAGMFSGSNQSLDRARQQVQKQVGSRTGQPVMLVVDAPSDGWAWTDLSVTGHQSVVVLSTPDCPPCDEVWAALRSTGLPDLVAWKVILAEDPPTPRQASLVQSLDAGTRVPIVVLLSPSGAVNTVASGRDDTLALVQQLATSYSVDTGAGDLEIGHGGVGVSRVEYDPDADVWALFLEIDSGSYLRADRRRTVISAMMRSGRRLRIGWPRGQRGDSGRQWVGTPRFDLSGHDVDWGQWTGTVSVVLCNDQSCAPRQLEWEWVPPE